MRYSLLITTREKAKCEDKTPSNGPLGIIGGTQVSWFGGAHGCHASERQLGTLI